MKRYRLLCVVALLLSAAGFGWMLPSVVFRIGDEIEARKAFAVPIRPIDLNYQPDMDTAARLRLANEAGQLATTPLERGIYLQQEDLEEIAEQFLRDATGYRFAVRGKENIMPILFGSFGDGTMIAWSVGIRLNEAWSWDALIDDQTGLILQCNFSGSSWPMDSLLYDYDGDADSVEYVAECISKALCHNFEARLSSEFTCRVERSNSEPCVYEGAIVLTQADETEYRIPIQVYFNGIIALN